MGTRTFATSGATRRTRKVTKLLLLLTPHHRDALGSYCCGVQWQHHKGVSLVNARHRFFDYGLHAAMESVNALQPFT